jgi:hypothetical protein
VFRTTLLLLKRRFASSTSRIPWPIASLTASSAIVLLLAGCGHDPPARAAPKLPAAVGSTLAEDADAIADALEAGDAVAARSGAATLTADFEAAVAAGDVPAALRTELLAAVARLVVALPDPEPPAPPEPQPKEKKPKKDKKGHGPPGKGGP